MTAADLQSALDTSGPSDVVTIERGVHEGPVTVGSPDGFSTRQVRGSGRNFAADLGVGTTIVCTREDVPAVNFLGARDSSISRLAVSGPYTAQARWHFPGTDLAAWPGKRSRYSPSVGVCVDYGATMNSARSSGVVVRDVEVIGFEVGIATQPGDVDGQGEFLTLDNCRVHGCAWGISISQTQARLLRVMGGDFLNVHTVLTNRTHGRQAGELDGLFQSTSFNTVARIADVNQAASGPLVFASCCGELIGSLGNFVTGGSRTTQATTFRDCKFDFRLATDKRALSLGGQLVLDGGSWLTQDIAVLDSKVEVRCTKFRPAFYESAPSFSPARRSAANLSYGMLCRPGWPQAKLTTAWFPFPPSSDQQVAGDGPGPSPRVRTFPKSQCDYANDSIVLPSLGSGGQLGAIVQDDQPGLTTWIVVGNPTGKRWTMERVSNLGATVDAAAGSFLLVQ